MSPEQVRGGAPAVEVRHLRKVYGDTVAVDDVSISVAAGEAFGIVGPNGAGKTTTVECVIGLRTPDAGSIRVFGLDPRADRARVREIVGVQLQAGALPAKATVAEILDLYRSFYRNPADVAALIDTLGLAEKRHANYRSLSGGQKQRLSLALALIGRPRVAILDEMTTGLDPQARRDTWTLIDGVHARGVSIILVSHFMDEVQRLCDRVAVIDRGRVIAEGTPLEIAERAGGGARVRFVPSEPFDESLVTRIPGVRTVERQGAHVVVSGSGDFAAEIVLALGGVGVRADELRIETVTLDDAFVRLTGAGADEWEAGRP